MKTWFVFIALLLTLALLIGCSPKAPPPTSEQTLLGEENTVPIVNITNATSKALLTPNAVETSIPIYGGTLHTGYYGIRTFDGHQLAGYGPGVTLPVFNQLVMFSLDYKETVPETIIGDLAESWETSSDGKEITFKLHQGVKWHDGVPFTADDVIYSMDKMTDVIRSAIADWFPAYDHTEKIDDYVVKVHLKYASAGFLMTLAQGESQIQPLHLAGLASENSQSAEFMVGTGPFILTEYLPGVHYKYKRNPDYWKKDKYNNQLPYLDNIYYHISPYETTKDLLISRKLDIPNTIQGAGTLDTYNYLKNGAPELLWQRRDRSIASMFFINTKHPPLDDIRVRRAMGLVLNEEDIIIGYAGDVKFGIPDSGVLPPSFGFPKEEILNLMGWDKPYDQRVAEAQQLMAEAGYPNGFKLNMMSTQSVKGDAGATLVFAEALHRQLKLDVEIRTGLGQIELQKRLKEDDYDVMTQKITTSDLVQLNIYLTTGGYANYANYSNPKLDEILAGLDHILDPEKRREEIWAIERILLTDLPLLPTGVYTPEFMAYYPWVKNLRFNTISYSNANRMEDIWIDPSIAAKEGRPQ